MINTLFGIKKNMTSSYDARGRRTGVTVLEIQPNIVTQVKSVSGKDGYNAVQLGIGSKKSTKKPQIGHAKAAGVDQKIRWFREVKEKIDIEPGTLIELGKIFAKGDAVKITGISKGKGFQGGVRRHGFHGGPKTHGQSDRHRAPGSIGSGTTPGRVLKGKKMAGHMGNETSTVSNLEVIEVKKAENLLIVKGAVPGYVGGLVQITKTGHIKGYTPPPEEKPEEEEESEDQKTGESAESVTENVETPVESVEVETEKGEENA
ncbi:MAG: 50S ribosomal protein L3 [Microgenomates group bacterium]|jgi:large subunit ribosomal protein L3